jgi:hypothetical protein
LNSKLHKTSAQMHRVELIDYWKTNEGIAGGSGGTFSHFL